MVQLYPSSRTAISAADESRIVCPRNSTSLAPATVQVISGSLVNVNTVPTGSPRRSNVIASARDLTILDGVALLGCDLLLLIRQRLHLDRHQSDDGLGPVGVNAENSRLDAVRSSANTKCNARSTRRQFGTLAK